MKVAAGIALQLVKVRKSFAYCRNLDDRLWNRSTCGDLLKVEMCTIWAPVR